MMQDNDSADLGARVRSAVFWRSGSQIAAQLVLWSSTFLVIRLLNPADYGLFAMTQIILSLMSLMNGYSFTGALVQQAGQPDPVRVRQVFGMLILMNGALAATQFLCAPLAAAYFREPQVAQLLRAQSVLHLFTPFIMVPQALLSRTIDFRTQARVNFAAALLAALVAPACALAGLGVWTLVIAPIALFGARAIGLAVIGRWLVWPSFRFTGAGAVFGFGGAMLVSDLFWFVQTQADVVIAGRAFAPHDLGLYTTALFLAQILNAKFVPALNEVAFPAYARIQHDRASVAAGFAKAVRIIMIAACPFSIGLALTAEPLVLTMLGDKWAGTIPVVRLLGLAMPFVTLQILFAPATNALGRPGIAARISFAGALIMPAAYLVGVNHGPDGMAAAWLFAFPLLTIAAAAFSLPVIGLAARDLVAALRPALLATGGMAIAVIALDTLIAAAIGPFPRLALLVLTGALAYAAALWLTARPAITELVGLLRRRPVAA